MRSIRLALAFMLLSGCAIVLSGNEFRGRDGGGPDSGGPRDGGPDGGVIASDSSQDAATGCYLDGSPGCLIADVCMPAGASDSNECRSCEPAQNPADWTEAEIGTACSMGTGACMGGAGQRACCSRWSVLSGGAEHTCAITEAGVLHCWGAVAGVAFGDGWLTLSAGAQRTCAIRDDGTLWCWLITASNPTQIGSDTWWAEVSVGFNHVCATATEPTGRTIWCWGDNQFGQLGVGDRNERTTPARVGADNETWAQVVAGDFHTCATKEDRTLWCWGDNSGGALGLGTGSLASYDSPQQVETSNDWGQITARGEYTCGLRNNPPFPSLDYTLWCWGMTIPESEAPLQVGADTDWYVLKGGGGRHHVCALRQDRSLWCWGANNDGQLGTNDSAPRDLPTRVGTDEWRIASAGDQNHTCAVRGDATLWCWGANGFGQLGTNDGAASHNVPTPVPCF